MDARKTTLEKINVVVAAALSLCSISAAAQGLSENVTNISASGSVFSALTHTRTDLGTTTETSSEPSLGVSGNLGGRLVSGANSLALQYGGTLETERDLDEGGQTDASSVTGASRFSHLDPGSRFDFNLGHTVTSVRNNTGFVVNPSSYDTRNTLSAGAGLRFYPGDLTTLRFSSRAGRSFGEDQLNDSESLTASTELVRRLSDRSMASIVGSRSWSDNGSVDTTIDSAQLVYNSSLQNGSFSFSVGTSKAETEASTGAVKKNESDAITGYIDRSWVSDEWRTSLTYSRRLSDSATDLSLSLPEEFDFLPETVRLTDLVVSDSLIVTHNTSLLCSLCSLGMGAEAAVLESEISGASRYEYRANVSMGIQVTNLQRVSLGYSWQGDAGEDSGTIIDQIHRLQTRWTRQLAEDTSFSVEFTQAYLRSRLDRSDQDQFTLRLILTRGFSLTGDS